MRYSRTTMPSYDYLIIGGGMAADSAVRGIREVDAEGSIGLIAEELHPPYDRPPLSKGLWQDMQVEEIMRDTDELGVTMHQGRRVLALDRAARTALDQHGDSYGYGKLLLATGGSPRRLSSPNEDVIYYRYLDDYLKLRELTAETRQVLLIGGGYIGAELAAALSQAGHQVQMVFPEFALLARLLPKELAAHLNSLFEERGISLLTGRNVESVAPHDQNGSLITLTDRQTIKADIVIAGLGLVPETALAAGAGLETADGITVNEFLQTSDEHVFAAGDVASIHSPALGLSRRIEHEENANLSGYFAGMAMAGQPQAYTHLPMFYTDLFDLGFEGVGLVDSRLETHADWDEHLNRGRIYYLKDGLVAGALAWNSPGELDRFRELIEERQVLPADRAA